MKSTCHCGTVSTTLASRPDKLTECNCSACWKFGALWAHAPIKDVTIDAPKGATLVYIRNDGDGDIGFHSCKICGCTTHWENLKPEGEVPHMAINARLANRSEIEGIRIRHFDGADTWKFLD